MSFVDSTHLMAQLAEMRNNRDDADVTLNCQEEVVKAHSFILGTRYTYMSVLITIYSFEKTIKPDYLKFQELG